MSETLSVEVSEPAASGPAAPPLRDLPEVTADDPEIALLLRLLDEATSHWRNEMMYIMSDEFPEGWGRVEPTIEQICWRPFPGGHSIGAVLLHIAGVEMFWLHEVAAGKVIAEEKDLLLLAPPAGQEAVDAVKWPESPTKPLSWYFAQLDAVRARTKELLRTASPNDIRTQAGDGQQVSMRWLLGYVSLHESYHGGQAVLLHLTQRAKTQTS